VTFQEIEFDCQKIASVRDIAEGEHNIPISVNGLARVGHSSVHEFVCNQQWALAHGLESPGEQEKHRALEQHRKQQILDWKQQNAEKRIPVSKKEITDTRRVSLKLQSLAAGRIRLFFAIPTKSSKRKVSLKNSNVCR
jgi:hypothetical protein